MGTSLIPSVQNLREQLYKGVGIGVVIGLLLTWIF